MSHRGAPSSSTWTERYTETINRNAIPVKDGAEELLSYLSARRVCCAVVTSTHSEMATHKLHRAGLVSHFEFIIGGEHVRNGKPDPEPYLTAATRLSIAPANCIALEDSENGVRSAVAAGMAVLQVPDLVAPSEELLLLDHQIYANLREVRDHFESSGWWS